MSTLIPALHSLLSVLGDDSRALKHSLRVGLQFCYDEPAMIVGILHDVAEASPQYLDSLAFAAQPLDIQHAVSAITRRDNEAYFDYIDRLSANPLAVRVKRADLWDNLSETNTLKPSLHERYTKALSMLEDF